MRYTWVLFLPLWMGGCATPQHLATAAPQPGPIAPSATTKVVETDYEVRSYRDAADPAIRHDAHIMYRRTRVPASVSDELVLSRGSFPPVSVVPLPASDELAAELATQKQITGDLRAMQASLAQTEQRMQAQFATLVRQSSEVMKVREQLESERARVRGATPAASGAAPAVAAVGISAEPKW